MSENRSIKVDLDFVNKLYMIAELTPPEFEDITLEKLNHLVDAIEDIINRLKISKPAHEDKFYESKAHDPLSGKEPGNVLIIDDLCIITYQLGVLYKNLGYHVTVAKDIYDAVDKYKKVDFNLVIMDLFLPTEKEGMILLDELVKLRHANNANVKIGVMTASSKKEHRNMCLQKGANFYVEKTENWQKQLVMATRGEARQTFN